MNTYEQKLVLDFEISSPELEQTINSYTELHKSRIFPIDKTAVDVRLVEFLKSFRLSVSHAEAFYTCPGRFTSIHVDGAYFDNHVKLNWVYGAPGSKMHWYALKDGATNKDYNTLIGTKSLHFNKEDCDVVWTAEVGQPSLVNVGGPHNIENCTDQGRWCLSLVIWDNAVDKRLEWNEAIEKFSPFFM